MPSSPIADSDKPLQVLPDYDEMDKTALSLSTYHDTTTKLQAIKGA